ncbi:MAG: hydantoinase/carbamoylase family amidase, partial [Chloroflexota bacterium]|nr:hydantoinase/carbamoylase family amidase [Chloroflexota bacterium]
MAYGITVPQPLSINPDRLHASIAELARIGATDGGGVTRLALTDEDRQGRDLLCSWLRDAGLEPRVDDVGNISAIRPGREAAPPVLLGSHIDTVVRGGRFDGALGVLGALEVIRTLNDHGIETRLPIGLVNWTNEEGVRFEPAMTCSGVATGRFTAEYVHERTDRAALRFGDELERIGYRGDEANRPLPASAYLELHIEQGPVLESLDLPVGVVGGIVGITWNEVTV